MWFFTDTTFSTQKIIMRNTMHSWTHAAQCNENVCAYGQPMVTITGYQMYNECCPWLHSSCSGCFALNFRFSVRSSSPLHVSKMFDPELCPTVVWIRCGSGRGRVAVATRPSSLVAGLFVALGLGSVEEHSAPSTPSFVIISVVYFSRDGFPESCSLRS